MIKSRKYYKGHSRIFIHGKVTNQDPTLRGPSEDPEWSGEDIDLSKPVVLHRQEWRDIGTGKVLAVTPRLSGIEEEGTIRNSDWFNGRIINFKDCMDDPPPVSGRIPVLSSVRP